MQTATISLLVLFFLISTVSYANFELKDKNTSTKTAHFHQLAAESINGKPILFSEYKGKVVLIVNTASQCGYTSQYKGLEAVYQKYKQKGLVVLGFPSNDFGGQEPGSNKEIKNFCEFKFKVTFPMFAKVNVTTAPLSAVYHFLTQTNPNTQTRKVPNWNFNKYLIDKKGKVAYHFSSNVEPESKQLTAAIEALIVNKK
jgi:glutathione peroxidase